MNILFLSNNLQNIKSANYQHEVFKYLNRFSNLINVDQAYLDRGYTLDNIIECLDVKPDVIFIGHSWLSDSAQNQYIDPYPTLKIHNCNLPKVVFLNKEYVNLERKLNWIKSINPVIVFTHSTRLRELSLLCDLNYIHIPFGYDEEILVSMQPTHNKQYHYKLFFSGVLSNNNDMDSLQDSRLRAMKSIFITMFDIPLFKKFRFRHMDIFWNSVPRSRELLLLALLMFKYKRLSTIQYYKHISLSQYIFCSLSPFELISPRFAEAFALGSIPIAEFNPTLAKAFPAGMIKFLEKVDANTLIEQLTLPSDDFQAQRDFNRQFAFTHLRWSVLVKKVIDEIHLSIKSNLS